MSEVEGLPHYCHVERSRDILPGILRVLYSQPDPSISVGMIV